MQVRVFNAAPPDALGRPGDIPLSQPAASQPLPSKRRFFSRRDNESVAGGKASPRATPPEKQKKTPCILKGCQELHDPCRGRLVFGGDNRWYRPAAGLNHRLQILQAFGLPNPPFAEVSPCCRGALTETSVKAQEATVLAPPYGWHPVAVLRFAARSVILNEVKDPFRHAFPRGGRTDPSPGLRMTDSNRAASARISMSCPGHRLARTLP
jgi:hypothetical protein